MIGSAISVLPIGLLVCWLMHSQERRAVSEQAAICAATITPGSDGDLLASIDRLLGKAPDVRAVGELDAFGNLRSVRPSRSHYVRAATLALEGAGEPVATGIEDPTVGRKLSGMVVGVEGATDPGTRQVVVLIARKSITSSLVTMLLLSWTILSLVGLGIFGSLRAWFQRQIVQPLRTLAPPRSPGEGAGAGWPKLETNGWDELEAIADAFRRFRRDVVESQQLKRNAQHAADEKIREERIGSDRKLQHAEQRASTDPLTGLANRVSLDENLEALFQHHTSSGEELSLIMFDVDNFKCHNDTYGHEAGDRALAFIGELLRGTVRSSDHAVRFGGDEFLLMLPGVTPLQAAGIAKRVLMLFQRFVASIGAESGLSLSAGIAGMSQKGALTSATLKKRADSALYTSKRNGKNLITEFDPDRHELSAIVRTSPGTRLKSPA